jgi:hypothetical protein
VPVILCRPKNSLTVNFATFAGGLALPLATLTTTFWLHFPAVWQKKLRLLEQKSSYANIIQNKFLKGNAKNNM